MDTKFLKINICFLLYSTKVIKPTTLQFRDELLWCFFEENKSLDLVLIKWYIIQEKLKGAINHRVFYCAIPKCIYTLTQNKTNKSPSQIRYHIWNFCHVNCKVKFLIIYFQKDPIPFSEATVTLDLRQDSAWFITVCFPIH